MRPRRELCEFFPVTITPPYLLQCPYAALQRGLVTRDPAVRAVVELVPTLVSKTGTTEAAIRERAPMWPLTELRAAIPLIPGSAFDSDGGPDLDSGYVQNIHNSPAASPAWTYN
ncbi:hypothetical protein EVAR_38081_1 [Eumeta japonica]|uniref:Uncharacterized protein n=1 Tax=Eumeta variegata TaxID=151549 RepID=A0A4C1WAZ6_EUMVA|nr:hypothetical protein EVAR_38081_1 [Eumeta japonica]